VQWSVWIDLMPFGYTNEHIVGIGYALETFNQKMELLAVHLSIKVYNEHGEELSTLDHFPMYLKLKGLVPSEKGSYLGLAGMCLGESQIQTFDVYDLREKNFILFRSFPDLTHPITPMPVAGNRYLVQTEQDREGILFQVFDIDDELIYEYYFQKSEERRIKKVGYEGLTVLNSQGESEFIPYTDFPIVPLFD
jgi:hypothetical protein